MNIKKILSIGLLFASIVLCGCPKKLGRLSLYIQNNSNHHIKPVLNGYYQTGPFYPDTSLSNKKPEGVNIPPGIKEAFEEARGSYSSLYNDLPSDTISFVIYDTDTLAKYSWEIIRQQYNILQRYDLSLQDLQKLNYTLYYPATPAMKDMKMWPKYKP
jgi:hypothetical protein